MEAMKVPLQQSDGTTPSKMPALAFSEPLSRVVLREAVEIFFDPKHAEPKHWEKLKEELTKKFTAPGRRWQTGLPAQHCAAMFLKKGIQEGCNLLSDYRKLVHPTF